MSCASLVLMLLAVEPPWERVSDEDGLVLEVQATAGADRLRVIGASPASAEEFARRWWALTRDTSASPEVTKRDMFIDGEDERLYYDVVRAPAPVTDRDYVVRASRSRDARSGVFTLR